MEEVFELALVVICAIIGIAAKAGKNKKKAESKPASRWDEVGDGKPAGINVSLGIEKLNEILSEIVDEDDEEDIPAAAIPAVPVQPAVAVPQQTVMPMPPVRAPEVNTSMEGDCDHPLHEPVVLHMPKPKVKPAAETPAMQLERLTAHKNAAVSGRPTAAQLRQAVIMSEVLGKPVALKGAYRR